MNQLSNQVQTKEIEGVYYQQNGRVEFRLQPNKLYSTNLIVSNLGLSKGANQARLHKWCGVYGAITNAIIYDGNVVLSQLQDLGEWAGFKDLTKENQFNENVQSYYNGGLLSNIWNQSDTNTNNTAEQVAGRDGSNFGARLQEGTIRGLSTLTTEAGTFKGLMKMRNYFDLLNSLVYIDTSVFKNFRIVLELSNDAQRILRQRTADTDLNTTRPFLVAQEIIDQEVVDSEMGKMETLTFREIERDQVVVPAVVGMTNANRYVEQPNNFHINSFNNKTLGKMLLWKQPALNSNTRDVRGGANSDIVGNGIFSSLALLNEVEQIRVNGRNLLPRNGIEGSGNRRLAKMVDSWGDMSLAPFNNGLANISDGSNIPRSNFIQTGNEDIGLVDYMGLEIGNEKCVDLQVDLSRRGVFINGGAGDNGTAICKYNSAINLVIYAEVLKGIVVNKDNSYNVVYV